jgi:xanthine dehydrogenase YagT iron-sulfur-binding subunit
MDEQDSNTAPDEQPTFEVTRRTVIETGTTALLLSTLPRAAFAAGPLGDDEPSPPAVKVHLRINGDLHSPMPDPRTTLLDALREHLALTGSKKERLRPRTMWRLHGADRRTPHQLLPDACGDA